MSVELSVFGSMLVKGWLTSLNIRSCPGDSPLVDDIVAELDEGLKAENEGGKATWLECFSSDVRWRTLNGMMLQFLQQ